MPVGNQLGAAGVGIEQTDEAHPRKTRVMAGVMLPQVAHADHTGP
jgi:hypothetical protein